MGYASPQRVSHGISEWQSDERDSSDLAEGHRCMSNFLELIPGLGFLARLGSRVQTPCLLLSI